MVERNENIRHVKAKKGIRGSGNVTVTHTQTGALRKKFIEA